MDLWDLPIEPLLKEWNRQDEGFTNHGAIRWLCLNDRFYLLTH